MGTKYCRHCRNQVATVQRYKVNHTAWAVLTVFSCGLLLIPWMLAVCLSMLQGSACQFCGR